MRKYNKEKVAEKMARRGVHARMERDPKVQANIAAIFHANGWTPEEGKSAYRTFLEYAEAADPEEINGERGVFGQRLSREEIATRLSERTKGIGTPIQVRRLMDRINEASARDSLLERLSKRDHEERELVIPEPANARAHVRAEDGRRAALKRAITNAEHAPPTLRDPPRVSPPSEPVAQRTEGSERSEPEEVSEPPQTRRESLEKAWNSLNSEGTE